MSGVLAKCEFCGKPVDLGSPNHYKRVLVWVGGPKKNSSKMSTETGEYGHTDCVHLAARGVAPDQEAMLFDGGDDDDAQG